MKRVADSTQKIFGAGLTVDHAGAAFKVQDITVTGNQIACVSSATVAALCTSAKGPARRTDAVAASGRQAPG